MSKLVLEPTETLPTGEKKLIGFSHQEKKYLEILKSEKRKILSISNNGYKVSIWYK